MDSASVSVAARAPSRATYCVRLSTEHQQHGAVSLQAGACFSRITGYMDIIPFFE